MSNRRTPEHQRLFDGVVATRNLYRDFEYSCGIEKQWGASVAENLSHLIEHALKDELKGAHDERPVKTRP